MVTIVEQNTDLGSGSIGTSPPEDNLLFGSVLAADIVEGMVRELR